MSRKLVRKKDRDKQFEEALQNERDFLRYLNLLKRAINDYTVLVSSGDTPFGPCFTPDVCKAYMRAGFSVNLYGRFRCVYVAVIDEGKHVFEKITDTPQAEFISVSYDLKGNHIEMLGSGHDMELGARAGIQINGQEYSQPGCGLNFAVYDKQSDRVVDTVHFHTYADSILAKRPQDTAKELIKYKEDHPGVSIVLFTSPRIPMNNLTEGEKFIRENHVTIDVILHNLDKTVSPLNQYYDTKGIMEVLSIPPSYHDQRGVRRFSDFRSKNVNIVGGHRVTLNQPSDFKHTIWFVGGCNIFGIGTDDSRTMPSVLQALLNERCPERKIIVQNYGFFLAQGDMRGMEEFTILESLPVKSGDIVIMSGNKAEGLYHVDASDVVNPPRTCEVFFDLTHQGPDGYRLIAERIFEGLKEFHLLDGNVPEKQHTDHMDSNDYGFTPSQSEELDAFRKTLMDFYRENLQPVIGSIVMNCNPFTLGHRHLIEEALKQCDYVVLFVVEEDKSYFPFGDRMNLVIECTKDIEDRVVIVPSGKFIISSVTFSEYFNKSEIQDHEIDPSMDVTVFAREIAPCMHITKRFAGEEPNDSITRQYNETMARILPEYGIEFIEIPRAEVGDEAVSASHVRKLLEDKEFQKIRCLVPEATYDYLTERFGYQEDTP